ncbi:hypothetical protein BpHYR1_045323, partial [Brachionus plicatilis]
TKKNKKGLENDLGMMQLLSCFLNNEESSLRMNNNKPLTENVSKGITETEYDKEPTVTYLFLCTDGI